MRLNTNPMNLFITNIHAPTEFKEDVKKDIFYKETKIVLDEAPKNTSFYSKIKYEI